MPAPPAEARRRRPPRPKARRAPRSATGGKRPNIVFILTDDLAWNLVQYMPHVLQMQKDGVTFANYFVTDSLCCPSRSSIFTGRFPHDTGIFRNTGKLTAASRKRSTTVITSNATFATALATAGLSATAMLGKYLNGYQPRQNPPEPGWSFWAGAGNGYPGFNYDLNENGRAGPDYGIGEPARPTSRMFSPARRSASSSSRPGRRS